MEVKKHNEMIKSRVAIDHLLLAAARPFDQVRNNFERQLGRFDAAAYSSMAAGESVAAVTAKMEAMAGTSGFMIFAVHDHGSLLKIAGLKRKALQYIIGNPLFAVQMTQHSIGASLYAPLRVLLCENDEGETCFEYDRPTSQFSQFGDERINEVAASLDEKLAALVATAIH
jgi:uncharacterized protein (DUF302 family)